MDYWNEAVCILGELATTCFGGGGGHDAVSFQV